MKDKAGSLEECVPIEEIWQLQLPDQNISVTTTQIQVSHSDIGPYVHVFCPEGHHVVGPTMVTCLKGGKWDDVTVPYCSTATYYGIPSSDLVIIGVAAGCAAVIICTLTIVLTHLLCFKRFRKLSSRDHGQSIESIPSTSASFTPKTRHKVSDPTFPTRNGLPIINVTEDQRSPDQGIPCNYRDIYGEICRRSPVFMDSNGELDIISSYSGHMTSPYCTTALDQPPDHPPPPPPPLREDAHTDRNGSYQGRSYQDRSYPDKSYPDRSYPDRSYPDVRLHNGAAYSNDGYVDDPIRNYAQRWEQEYRAPQTASLSVPDVYVRPIYSTPGRTVL